MVATPADLPVPAPPDARGLYLDGTAYIVASTQSLATVPRTLGHEVLVHYGLRTILGAAGMKRLLATIQNALKAGNVPLLELQAEVRRVYVDEAGQFNLTPEGESEEIAARAVERGVDPETGQFRTGMSWLKQVWARAAGFLRRLKINVPFTVAELHGMLAASARNVRSGKARPAQSGGVAGGSVAASRGERAALTALEALRENDELFDLPKSKKKTVEGIAQDNDVLIKVETHKQAGNTTYRITLPDGSNAWMVVRPAPPSGEGLYGFEMEDGYPTDPIDKRPGANAGAVAAHKEDVWIDVSRLKTGGSGATVYNIAATYAHNTGRVFIADPSGISDIAMRRRTEHMLSSSLKFGTTDHLAPHPRQVAGDAEIGVPPLHWTYGDHLSNIDSLIRTSLGALNHGAANPLTFEPFTGRFLDRSGRVLDARALQQVAFERSERAGNVGVKTLKRGAVLHALLRETGGESGGGRRRNGILDRLLVVTGEHPASTHKIFYGRGQPSSLIPQTPADAGVSASGAAVSGRGSFARGRTSGVIKGASTLPQAEQPLPALARLAALATSASADQLQ